MNEAKNSISPPAQCPMCGSTLSGAAGESAALQTGFHSSRGAVLFVMCALVFGMICQGLQQGHSLYLISRNFDRWMAEPHIMNLFVYLAFQWVEIIASGLIVWGLARYVGALRPGTSIGAARPVTTRHLQLAQILTGFVSLKIIINLLQCGLPKL